MEKNYTRISLKLHKLNDKDILDKIKDNKQKSIKDLIRKGNNMDIHDIYQKQIDELQKQIKELEEDKEKMQQAITELCYEKGVLQSKVNMLEIELGNKGV